MGICKLQYGAFRIFYDNNTTTIINIWSYTSCSCKYFTPGTSKTWWDSLDCLLERMLWVTYLVAGELFCHLLILFSIIISHTQFSKIYQAFICVNSIITPILLLNKAGCLCFKAIINLSFLFVIFGLKCSILSTYLYTSLYFFGFHFSVILLVLCLLQGWLWARSCSSCDWFSYRCYSIFWEIWWSCWCFRCDRSHKCAKKVSTFWLMWIRVFAIKTERLYCFSLDILWVDQEQV